MDRERLKDGVEDGVAATVEAAVSMIPIAGGPLAVVVNRAFGSAVERRLERDIAELREDLDAVVRAHDIPDPAARLSRDEFVAAMYTVVPALQATSFSEKRKLLRNALINGTVIGNWDDYRRESFLRQMASYDPLHVQILKYAASLAEFKETEMPETGVWRDLVSLIVDKLLQSREELRAVVQRAVNQLATDGLLTQAQPQTRGLQNLGEPSRPDSISPLGQDFLAFVADPLAP